MPPKPSYKTAVDSATIGRHLREIRKRRGLTQVELAEKLGMQQTLYSSYERGRLRVPGGLIASFAQALNVSADEILGLRTPKPERTFRDPRLVRRLQALEKLSRANRQAILKTLDAFLERFRAA
jgi:transcriptional regulator with XRE-family HTH domain